MSWLFTSGGQSVGVSASTSSSLFKHLGCNFFHFYFPSSIIFHLVFFVHFVNILTSFTVLLSLFFLLEKRGLYGYFPQINLKYSSFILGELYWMSPNETWVSICSASLRLMCCLVWVLDHFYGDTKSFSIKSFLPKENITQKIKCRRKQLT